MQENNFFLEENVFEGNYYEIMDNIKNQLKYKQITRNLKKFRGSEDFFSKYNNFNDVILTTFTNSTLKNEFDIEKSFLESILFSLKHEKSDVLKLQYIHFINDNISQLINNDSSIFQTLKTLHDLFFNEIIFGTNILLIFHCIQAITNFLIFYEGKTNYTKFYNQFKDFLLETIKDQKTKNRTIRTISLQSLIEFESIYPGEFSQLLKEEESLANYRKDTSNKNISCMSDFTGFREAISVRNSTITNNNQVKSLLYQNNLLNNKKNDLFSLYQQEKSNIFAFYLLLLMQIFLNSVILEKITAKNATFSKIVKVGFGSINLSQKNKSDIKRLISSIRADLNHFNYFTHIKIKEGMQILLELYKMPEQVILPLYSTLLKFHGNLHALSLILIIQLFNDEKVIKKEGEELIGRLFSDINNKFLSNREKNLILYWLINLHK